MEKEVTTAEYALQVRKNVYEILERYPETRDDDRKLMLRYWYHVDRIAFDYTFPERFVQAATNPESITRARRTIQNKEGLFPATEERAVERRTRQLERTEHHRVNG